MPPPDESLFDKFPRLGDLLLLLATVFLVALIVWFLRGKSAIKGFAIHVDENDIAFSGEFPPKMQTMVVNFLRHDVALPGAYVIRGHWDRSGGNPILIVAVQGEHARAMEQRIRNFMKLNIKPPR